MIMGDGSTMDNSSLVHSKWNCKYHIIFANKKAKLAVKEYFLQIELIMSLIKNIMNLDKNQISRKIMNY